MHGRIAEQALAKSIPLRADPVPVVQVLTGVRLALGLEEEQPNTEERALAGEMTQRSKQNKIP